MNTDPTAGPLARVMLVTEGLPGEREAERCAFALADRHAAVLTAVVPLVTHAVLEAEHPQAVLRAERAAAATLRWLQTAARERALRFEPAISRGEDAVAAIVRAARTHRCDLLVIGAPPRGAHWLRGAGARRRLAVLGAALECPMLCIPADCSRWPRALALLAGVDA
jgi:nucleotide-binding universal stress UspA family protein